VRLRGAFIIKCNDVIKDAQGQVSELHCTFDPSSKSGMEGSSRKVKGTIHWLSARHALRATVRLYDRLFSVANPDEDGDYRKHLNPDSKKTLANAYIEPSLASAKVEEIFQFERCGYFVADQFDHKADAPTFNRAVTLRDSWTATGK
jgi:glutaminyl-tRNA synthetase